MKTNNSPSNIRREAVLSELKTIQVEIMELVKIKEDINEEILGIEKELNGEFIELLYEDNSARKFRENHERLSVELKLRERERFNVSKEIVELENLVRNFFIILNEK